MSEAVVAKRYADALFQLADEQNKAENIIDELAVVKAIFKENEKLISLLQHPQVSMDDKMNLIDEAFSTCDKDLRNTLKLLVSRDRISNVIEMMEQVTEKYNEANGIATATVFSVRELSETEKGDVAASLAYQLSKKEIFIDNVVDPSVIGGLKIRVGNTIYDGTISGKLNKMKHNIGTPSI